MTKLSKNQKVIREKVQPGKSYSVKEAIELLQSLPKAKFSQSFDVAVRLGIDPRKFNVRGSTVLPHGLGKSVRIAVFAQGPNADLAKKAGADQVGMEDLAEVIKAGTANFDVVIATPDTMGVVGRLGTVLGPKGLMPNPKVGTVTTDVTNTVKNFKAGQARFRTDKAGIVHCSVGKLDFKAEQLVENLLALMTELRKQKPLAAKGIYFKKVSVSSTMGPGLTVDMSSIGSF